MFSEQEAKLVTENRELRAEVDRLRADNQHLQKSIEELEDEVDKSNDNLIRFVRAKAGRRDCHGVYDGIEQICNQRKAAESLVAVLRGALEVSLPYVKAFPHTNAHDLTEIQAALALTPASAGARLKAEAYREAANLIRQTTPSRTSQYDDYGSGKEDGRHYAIEQLESEADSLTAKEKEAADGR